MFIPPWNAHDRKVYVICGGLGFNSIRQGPGVHYIDECALADPLLSRLPAKENPHWRIGHFYRQLPTDYIESIEKGENILADEKTARYWESIRIITRNALFDKSRVAEIFRVNFGLTEKSDWIMYRKDIIPRTTIIPIIVESDITEIRNDGTLWNSPGNIVFYSSLDIKLAKKVDIVSIDISVDNNDVYQIDGLVDEQWKQIATINPTYRVSGLVRHKIILKNAVSNVEKIRLSAHLGDGMYSIGHFLVNTQ